MIHWICNQHTQFKHVVASCRVTVLARALAVLANANVKTLKGSAPLSVLVVHEGIHAKTRYYYHNYTFPCSYVVLTVICHMVE